jgi:hypothetical protein
MNLTAYVKRRNGVPIGYPNALKNSLYRSLGARNFYVSRSFWNPILGYYLGAGIFKTLKRIIPAAPALVLTFVFLRHCPRFGYNFSKGKDSVIFFNVVPPDGYRGRCC